MDIAFSTADLVQVVPTLKRPTTFLLDRFFPNVQNPESEYVAIDIEVGKRRMAAFVSPLVQGRLTEARRTETKLFKPAYIKDKRAPDLKRPLKRQIGEKIGGGGLKPGQREMANINYEMQDQIEMIMRRLEWMAAQALLTGQVLIEGEGHPAEIVDFGRDPSLTVALTGNNKWGVASNFDAEGRDPIPEKTIEQAQKRLLRLSGAQANDLVFTTSAWECFKNGKNIYGAIFMPKLSDAGNSINPGAQIAPGAVYKGKWGQYDLWLYNEWFVDEDDVEQPMLPDGAVIISGTQLDGTRAFGVIEDPKFNYQSMPFAPKTWINEDPAQRMMMMQSAPIVIPTRVNASMALTVCDPQDDLLGGE